LKDSHRFFSGFWFYRSTRVSLRPGGTFEGWIAKGLGGYSRKEIDELTEFVKQFGAKGLLIWRFEASGEHRSTFAKFLSPEKTERVDWTDGGGAWWSDIGCCR
jgi:aspartyl-tRNA synthetase